MRDRHTPDGGVRGDGPACAYCLDEAVEAGRWPPERLAHLYLCRGLSTYRIAGLSGLDRRRVTRTLRDAGVPVRPRGAGRLRPVRRDDPVVPSGSGSRSRSRSVPLWSRTCTGPAERR